MSVITQGYGSSLVVTQGYGASVTPITPPSIFGGGIAGGGRKRRREQAKEVDRLREEDEIEETIIVSALYRWYMR